MSLDVYLRGILLIVSPDLFPPSNPAPQSQLNRDAIVQKERDFIHSLSLLFITEERRGWVRSLKSKQLMEKKDDSLEAGGRGGKEIEDLNVFFRPFPSSPSAIFSLFKEISWHHFKEATFSSLTCKCSPLSHLFHPRGHLQNLEWGPQILCAPSPS